MPRKTHSVTVKFTTENAAFDDDEDLEIGRILTFAAEVVKVEGLRGRAPLMDWNGNRVGFLTVRAKGGGR